jgi:hypothetical protein
MTLPIVRPLWQNCSQAAGDSALIEMLMYKACQDPDFVKKTYDLAAQVLKVIVTTTFEKRQLLK